MAAQRKEPSAETQADNSTDSSRKDDSSTVNKSSVGERTEAFFGQLIRCSVRLFGHSLLFFAVVLFLVEVLYIAFNVVTFLTIVPKDSDELGRLKEMQPQMDALAHLTVTSLFFSLIICGVLVAVGKVVLKCGWLY